MHNPITNPMAEVNQNPYLRKSQNFYGSSGSLLQNTTGNQSNTAGPIGSSLGIEVNHPAAGGTITRNRGSVFSNSASNNLI
jgi:hypothetical protein